MSELRPYCASERTPPLPAILRSHGLSVDGIGRQASSADQLDNEREQTNFTTSEIELIDFRPCLEATGARTHRDPEHHCDWDWGAAFQLSRSASRGAFAGQPS
jgi:hypothetical protein